MALQMAASLLRPLVGGVFVVMGCSIEGARQLGEPCLMARECASPLRCEVISEGVSRCVASTRLDLPAGDASAPPDTATDVPLDAIASEDQSSPVDAWVDLSAPMDVPREAATGDMVHEPSPGDVSVDTAFDEGRSDVATDFAHDVDVSSDDRPREVTD